MCRGTWCKHSWCIFMLWLSSIHSASTTSDLEMQLMITWHETPHEHYSTAPKCCHLQSITCGIWFPSATTLRHCQRWPETGSRVISRPRSRVSRYTALHPGLKTWHQRVGVWLQPFHFPNPGLWSGAEPPADGRPGMIPPENFWNSVCDLVHFCVIWWQLFVGCQTWYICNSAIKIEPICQLPCHHDCTAVLSVLSNEHALKSGTFGVPGMVLPGRGTTWHKSGTSR